MFNSDSFQWFADLAEKAKPCFEQIVGFFGLLKTITKRGKRVNAPNALPKEETPALEKAPPPDTPSSIEFLPPPSQSLPPEPELPLQPRLAPDPKSPVQPVLPLKSPVHSQSPLAPQSALTPEQALTIINFYLDAMQGLIQDRLRDFIKLRSWIGKHKSKDKVIDLVYEVDRVIALNRATLDKFFISPDCTLKQFLEKHSPVYEGYISEAKEAVKQMLFDVIDEKTKIRDAEEKVISICKDAYRKTQKKLERMIAVEYGISPSSH